MNLSVILFVIFAHSINAYNILVYFSVPMKSHFRFFKPFILELAMRNHNVTLYSIIPLEIEDLSVNMTVVDISDCVTNPFGEVCSIETPNPTTMKVIHSLYNSIPQYETVQNCSPIMDLIRSDEKYDAVITDLFFPDWYTMFAYKFKAPLITVFPNFIPPYISMIRRMPSNPSYIPAWISDTTSKMNFFERIQNLGVYLLLTVVKGYYLSAASNALSRRLFSENVPSVEEVMKNTSLMLINVDFSYHYAIPLVPNVIPIPGIHIGNSKPLPENIEKFINESEHGVVYFCMGSLLRGETFPEEKRNAFLYAFSKIPQRVLWKWEGDVLPGKSDNIMISKWMPQRDILAHPNVKLFISHGGLLGTSEAVYEGVPVLGIPIFGDQRTNIKSLEANGAGELLDYNEISKEVVLEKIQRLLNDPKYKENAKQLSARYRDRPMSPLDTAVYWTEYVIRHKGAPHLRTAAADMPWYQYLLLDVIAFLIVIFVSALAIIYYSVKLTFRFLCNLICGKKSSSKPVKKVKRN